MRKEYFIIVMLTVAGFSSYAQSENQPAPWKGCACGFQSLFQGGLLEGAAGPAWNLQIINGIYYKTWFTGIGVGIDYYNMRTIPLFIDVRKDLFRKRRTPFLYADAGIQFDWLKSSEKPGWGSSDYDQGYYYDFGGGYKFGIGKRDALLVSAGYTLKTLREERVLTIQCIQPPCTSDYYKYAFTRLTFKVGWQF